VAPRRIKGLGEIALRVDDLDGMQGFYEQVIGLELMRRSENDVFFKLCQRAPKTGHLEAPQNRPV